MPLSVAAVLDTFVMVNRSPEVIWSAATSLSRRSWVGSVTRRGFRDYWRSLAIAWMSAESITSDIPYIFRFRSRILARRGKHSSAPGSVA